ncbi:MAG: preprotein translocase subunit YajC [Bacteroidales bacterium]
MNELLSILLMANPNDPKGSMTSSLIMMLLIIVVFYFFMIRPQMKRQKELKNFREGLKKGDNVITSGGIYGKISEVREQIILLEVDKTVQIKVDKSAVMKDPSDIADK